MFRFQPQNPLPLGNDVNTLAPLNGGGTGNIFFAFRAQQALAMGAVTLTMDGGAWTANDASYWQIVIGKNGVSAGLKTLQTIASGGTGNIAQGATVTLFPAGFTTCAKLDVFIVSFAPINNPVNLPICDIVFDLSLA